MSTDHQIYQEAKGRQRSRSVPYTQVRASKRKVIQLLRRKKLSNSGNLQQPFSYKDFEEIWEGNVEYTDETSENDILKYICNSFNSQSSENTSVVGVTDIKPSQLKFVHRKNGKLTTRASVVYDGAGIQCSYRQGTVYLIYQTEDKHLPLVQTNLESFLCESNVHEMQNTCSCSGSCSVPTRKGSNNAIENNVSTVGSGFAPRISSLQHGTCTPSSSNSIGLPQWMSNLQHLSSTTSLSNATSTPASGNSGVVIDNHMAPSTDLTNSSEDVKRLVMEAGFTKEDAEKGILACGSLADASHVIEWICDSQDTIPFMFDDSGDEEQTPEELLRREVSKLVDQDDDHFLHVNRCEIWKAGLTFYKQCMENVSKLHRNLVVCFEREEGIDAGAIKVEFFNCLIEEMDKRFFEGLLHSRVPKKSWGNSHHVIAGMIIGHSLLQSGPAYPVLAPCVYSYLCSASEDTVMQSTDMLPRIDDIPKDASTIAIHDLIHKMDEASTQEDVDAILDVPEYLEVINGSGWPCTQPISISNKSEIVQGLITEEVVRKRVKSMDDLRKGLKIVGILPLLESYPTQLKKFMVDGDQPITVEEFKREFSKKCTVPTEYPECQVYQWFMEYIDEGVKTSEEFPQGRLVPLLQFSTSYKRIPPLGLRFKLTIEYLPDDEKNELPMSHACFGIIKLPVVHTSKTLFFKKMDTALAFGAKGFGMM